AIVQDVPCDRVRNPAHLLHAWRCEPDLVADEARSSAFSEATDQFVLDGVGNSDLVERKRVPDRVKVRALVVLAQESGDRLSDVDHVSSTSRTRAAYREER